MSQETATRKHEKLHDPNGSTGLGDQSVYGLADDSDPLTFFYLEQLAVELLSQNEGDSKPSFHAVKYGRGVSVDRQKKALTAVKQRNRRVGHWLQSGA